MELFVNEEYGQYDFLQARDKYFGLEYEPTTYVQLMNVTDQDIGLLQLQQFVFDEQLQRCETCSQKWFKPNSIDSWIVKFRAWVNRGECSLSKSGIDPFSKIMHPAAFQICLSNWMNEDKIGRTYQIDLKIEEQKILGWK